MKPLVRYWSLVLAVLIAVVPLDAWAKSKHHPKSHGGASHQKHAQRTAPARQPQHVRRAPQHVRPQVAQHVRRAPQHVRPQVAHRAPAQVQKSKPVVSHRSTPSHQRSRAVAELSHRGGKGAQVSRHGRDLRSKQAGVAAARAQKQRQLQATAAKERQRAQATAQQKHDGRGRHGAPGKARIAEQPKHDSKADARKKAIAAESKHERGSGAKGSREHGRAGAVASTHQHGKDKGKNADRDRREHEKRAIAQNGREQRGHAKSPEAKAGASKPQTAAADPDRQKHLKAARARQLARWREQHQDRVQQFRREQERRYAAVRQQRQLLRASRAAAARTERIQEVRERVRDYWRDRADEVRERIADRRDSLFDAQWWQRRHWNHRDMTVVNSWWWWQPVQWNTVNVFLDAGWNEPVLYDYGTDVVIEDGVVYRHGERLAGVEEYSREVIRLADPGVDPASLAPVDSDEWRPLGVFALVQENQGNAVMFFQLSVNKDGLISGGYANVVSGEELPVIGRVDRTTQRAAWHIGDRTERVFEAGIANLAQDQASCLLHVGADEMQPWLLVRLEAPELPETPAALTQLSPSQTY